MISLGYKRFEPGCSSSRLGLELASAEPGLFSAEPGLFSAEPGLFSAEPGLFWASPLLPALSVEFRKLV